jgi:glycosyltransferase involved in cell wall biosynthesis
MINGKKIVVVMPAYNAEKTLEQTYSEIPLDIVDEVILTDDFSTDRTTEIAKNLKIAEIHIHDRNKGYGANQKTCYNRALDLDADIVIMLHPDYQYTPKLINSIAHMIASGLYPAVMASRILGKGALRGGMPLIKYIANRILTLIQNLLMSQKMSEYHSGYRAFDAKVLKSINYNDNSDDFIFDNEMIAQIFYAGFDIGEISCPTKYFNDSSSINYWRSVIYGLGVLRVSLVYLLTKNKLIKSKLFQNAHNDI